jgi:hypothetical protein
MFTNHNYDSGNQYNEMGGAYGRNRERASEDRVLVKKPVGQRPL